MCSLSTLIVVWLILAAAKCEHWWHNQSKNTSFDSFRRSPTQRIRTNESSLRFHQSKRWVGVTNHMLSRHVRFGLFSKVKIWAMEERPRDRLPDSRLSTSDTWEASIFYEWWRFGRSRVADWFVVRISYLLWKLLWMVYVSRNETSEYQSKAISGLTYLQISNKTAESDMANVRLKSYETIWTNFSLPFFRSRCVECWFIYLFALRGWNRN